jgi:hypothetical protein
MGRKLKNTLLAALMAATALTAVPDKAFSQASPTDRSNAISAPVAQLPASYAGTKKVPTIESPGSLSYWSQEDLADEQLDSIIALDHGKSKHPDFIEDAKPEWKRSSFKKRIKSLDDGSLLYVLEKDKSGKSSEYAGFLVTDKEMAPGSPFDPSDIYDRTIEVQAQKGFNYSIENLPRNYNGPVKMEKTDLGDSHGIPQCSALGSLDLVQGNTPGAILKFTPRDGEEKDCYIDVKQEIEITSTDLTVPIESGTRVVFDYGEAIPEAKRDFGLKLIDEDGNDVITNQREDGSNMVGDVLIPSGQNIYGLKVVTGGDGVLLNNTNCDVSPESGNRDANGEYLITFNQGADRQSCLVVADVERSGGGTDRRLLDVTVEPELSAAPVVTPQVLAFGVNVAKDAAELGARFTFLDEDTHARDVTRIRLDEGETYNLFADSNSALEDLLEDPIRIVGEPNLSDCAHLDVTRENNVTPSWFKNSDPTGEGQRLFDENMGSKITQGYVFNEDGACAIKVNVQHDTWTEPQERTLLARVDPIDYGKFFWGAELEAANNNLSISGDGNNQHWDASSFGIVGTGGWTLPNGDTTLAGSIGYNHKGIQQGNETNTGADLGKGNRRGYIGSLGVDHRANTWGIHGRAGVENRTVNMTDSQGKELAIPFGVGGEYKFLEVSGAGLWIKADMDGEITPYTEMNVPRLQVDYGANYALKSSMGLDIRDPLFNAGVDLGITSAPDFRLKEGSSSALSSQLERHPGSLNVSGLQQDNALNGSLGLHVGYDGIKEIVAPYAFAEIPLTKGIDRGEVSWGGGFTLFDNLDVRFGQTRNRGFGGAEEGGMFYGQVRFGPEIEKGTLERLSPSGSTFYGNKGKGN